MLQGDGGISLASARSAAGNGEDETLELTSAQLRIWLDSRISDSDRWANLGDTLEVFGPLDLDLLRRAVGRAVEQTAALRLQLIPRGALPPLQRIAAEIAPDVSILDFTRGASDAVWQAWLRREHQRPLPMAGPLFRFAVLRLAAEHFLISFVGHHCCLDGAGLSIVWSRVASAFEELAKGGAAQRLRDDGQYREYTAGQLALRDHESTRLAQAPSGMADAAEEVTLSRLPAADAPRSGSVRARRDLPGSLGDRVRQLAKRLGLRPSRVLIGIAILYVGRFIGLEEFHVLLPVNGRRERGHKRLVAMCASTICARFRVDSEAPTGTVLKALRVQLDTALKRAAAHRPAEHRRAVGVSINYIDFAAPATLGNLRARPGPYESLGPINDLEILFDWRDEATPRMELWGNSRVYTGLDLDGHLSRLLHWVETLLAQPDVPVRAQPIMAAMERDLVLRAWNDTARTYAAPPGLHELFELQASRTPDAVASVCGDSRLSYRGLSRRSNQLAHYLRSKGVSRDSVIGIAMQRSHAMIVGMLGVLKAGGGYLPLDPNDPPERAAFMLEDAKAAILLTHADSPRWVREARVVVVDIDADGARIDLEPHEDPCCQIDPLQLAYVIYTSGSTGKPKAAMNVHGAVVNRICWMQERYSLGESDRVLQKTPYTFDVSVWELFWPLAFGGQLVFAKPGGHRDPEYLLAAIERFGITLIHFVPSMLKQMLTRITHGRCASLRDTFCSGEALPGELAADFTSVSSSRLHNLYGPTEAAIDVSAHAFAGALPNGAVSIGTPIANLQLYVLDRRLEPCPPGVRGELYIGGVGLARGYLGRPGLTADCFIADPFGPPGGRVYRTRDEARYLADGGLEFLGRADQQVKIRGMRVEPGEVEAALSAHPQVAEAAVVARSNSSGEALLVAYFTAESAAIDPAALREHLRSRLPDHMIPAAYKRLRRMPLTPSGKLDRRALPEPDEGDYRSRVFEAPRTPIERELVAVWQEILGNRRIGRLDNFFELGGSSLSGTRVVEKLYRRGFTSNVSDVFRFPILAELASVVVRVATAVAGELCEPATPSATVTPDRFPLAPLQQAQLDRIAARVPGGGGNIQDIYPLTALQEGMLFHHMMSRRRDPYTQYIWIELQSREVATQVIHAMPNLVRRHDVLRSAFFVEGTRPLQVVLADVSWSVEEVHSGADADVKRTLRDRFDSREHRLDVRHPPLMRAYLAHDAPRDRWILLWLVHHLVCDWLSVQLLIDELRAFVAGQSHELPPPSPYRRFVARTRAAAADGRHEEFFRRMLGTFVVPTVVPRASTGDDDDEGIEEACVLLQASVARHVRESSRGCGVSIAAVCHLAFAICLAQFCSQRDVVFGTVLFGRGQRDSGLTDAVGLFVNTLPVRVRVDERTVPAAIRDIACLLGDLLQHEQSSLLMARDCSGLPPSVPLISSLLNYRHARRPSFEGGFEVLHVEGRTNYTLLTWIDDDDRNLQIGCQITGGLSAEYVCNAMGCALDSVAVALDEAPGTLVSDLLRSVSRAGSGDSTPPP